MSVKDDGGDRKPDDENAVRPASSRKVEPRKDGIAHKASPVGRALRTVYDDMLRESVPDDFLDLLKKLD